MPRSITRRLYPRALLAVWCCALAGSGLAAEGDGVAIDSQADLSAEVKDLKYGEVLFHFFQEEYFTSAVMLEVAQRQQRIPGNAGEAELLRGGLYLSYGLHQEAERIFDRLLGQSTGETVRNRAWFYLGKIRYRKGLFDEAGRALAQVEPGALEPDQQVEYRNIQANLLMARGQFGATAELLGNAADDNALAPFDRYNLGVARLAAGDTDKGIATLEQLAETRFEREELKALADKAWVALGFAHLAEAPLKARHYLEQVRLNGPFSNRALLGVGWANYVVEDYRAALRPWLELRERPRTDHNVYESYLAVASAVERLAAGPQAVEAYTLAIDTYRAGLEQVDRLIAEVEAGNLPAMLLGNSAGAGLGGFHALRLDPAAEDLVFLRDLIAGNTFQEALRNFNDLRELRTRLNRWELEIPAYRHMLELRRHTYEEGLRQLAGEEAVSQVAVLQERRERYARILEQMQRRDQAAARFQRIDPNKIEQLATPEELQLMERLEAVKQRLDTHPDLPDRETYEQRYRLLSGLLYWNISTDFKPRFWAVKKQLNEVDRLLIEALEKQLALERAAESAPRLFTGYNDYIEALGLRIADIRERIDRTYDLQLAALNQLALNELTRQRQRLVGYLDQARFSLARLKDRATQRPPVVQ